MEKIIEIDIFEEDDFYEKFNKKKISKELIEYIVDRGMGIKKSDNIKIVVNSKVKSSLSRLIIEGLEEEYQKCIFKYKISNFTQIIYFILGVLFLFLSTFIYETIFKEIVVIGGWVFIWGMIETELFSDINSIKRRRILKKLLNSEIVVLEEL